MWCSEFEYVAVSKAGNGYFYCSACLKDVACSHMGRADVQRHCAGPRHIQSVSDIKTRATMNMDAYVDKSLLETSNLLFPHKNFYVAAYG